MVELAYTLRLERSGFGYEGSSPSDGTIAVPTRPWWNGIHGPLKPGRGNSCRFNSCRSHNHAVVVELVDTPFSNSGEATHAGSIPADRTMRL